MHEVGAAEVLQAWEDSLDLSPTRRALTLLSLISGDQTPAELAELPIGERDVGLMRLRAQLFGDEVEAFCACPSCGEELDVAFQLHSILAGATEATESAGGRPTVTVNMEGCEVELRAPRSADIMAVYDEPDPARSAAALRNRLVLNVRQPGGGEPQPPGLPENLIDAVSAEISRLDPFANVELELTCAACKASWPTVFDVTGFLWAEVSAWARHMLRDVHTLARAYGWREHDILAMGSLRRQGYLELVRE
jgi:hypothetical protein